MNLCKGMGTSIIYLPLHVYVEDVDIYGLSATGKVLRSYGY